MPAASPNTTDWITAGASVFAAVGTVGAVAVALWQTRQQGKRKLKVTCRHGVSSEAPGESTVIVVLRATNVGYRPVKLTQAYIRMDNGDQAYIPAAPYSEALPVLLQDGQSAEVIWRQTDIDRFSSKNRNCKLLYAYFTDVADGIYGDVMPGIRRVRRGWRLRPQYVPRKS